MRYFEDFERGQEFDCGARTVSQEEAIAFARAYDPQPFHIDPEAAAASPLGGLALSGWHTGSITMRLYYEAVLKESGSLGAPGLNEMSWSAPVRPGAPIYVRLNVLDKRESRSRPEMGFVSLEAVVTQNETEVSRFSFPAMIARRGRSDAPKRVADRTRADAADLFKEARPAEEMLFMRAADIPFGALYDLGEAEFTAEEIIAFAKDFDPQPFHVDEAAGKASAFGGLTASGWQVCAYWMRALVGGLRKGIARAASPEEAAALARVVGPSPGVEDLRWRLPAVAGDRFRYFTRLIRLEETPKRADWAILVMESGAVNQFGALAFSFVGRVMVRRDATAA